MLSFLIRAQFFNLCSVLWWYCAHVIGANINMQFLLQQQIAVVQMHVWANSTKETRESLTDQFPDRQPARKKKRIQKLVKEWRWHTADSVCSAKKNREPHIHMTAGIEIFICTLREVPRNP